MNARAWLLLLWRRQVGDLRPVEAGHVDLRGLEAALEAGEVDAAVQNAAHAFEEWSQVNPHWARSLPRSDRR